MTLEFHTKFEKKLTRGLENDMWNLTNFDQNTCKCQNWDFDRILLSKIENAELKHQRGVMCNDTQKSQKLTFNELLLTKLYGV